MTRSDGKYMSSRVSTSANAVLGMEDLSAEKGPAEYTEIATKLGTNATYFQSVRNKLIGTCLQRNPMHPYWDVSRYVANFERGLKSAWLSYLVGNETSHIYVTEEQDDDTKEDSDTTNTEQRFEL